jgi:hypothetical protein
LAVLVAWLVATGIWIYIFFTVPYQFLFAALVFMVSFCTQNIQRHFPTLIAKIPPKLAILKILFGKREYFFYNFTYILFFFSLLLASKYLRADLNYSWPV